MEKFRTTVYLPPELHRRAKIAAIEKKITLSDLVVLALAAYLEGEEARHGKRGGKPGQAVMVIREKPEESDQGGSRR